MPGFSPQSWSLGYFLSDSQFKFRKGLSTVDAVFVLHNLIQSFINNKMRLPCAFIDLKKAFDSVYRNALWFKLFRSGFDGKINCFDQCMRLSNLV